MSSQKAELPMLTALEQLVQEGSIKLLLPTLVRDEFERNKNKVIEATRKRLSSEFRTIRGVVETYGGSGKDGAIETLDDLNRRLPILSEATQNTVERVLKLFDMAEEIEISNSAKIKAAERAISKIAPFHKQKNSVADAVLVETFDEFRLLNGGAYASCRFVTHNVTDFADKDHRKPHTDFANIFDGKSSLFFNSTSSAIEDLLDLDEFHYEYSFAWEDETRGLQEIMSAMDELFDKVWYNRHMNMMYRIENGEIRIVPSGSSRGGDVIHEDILVRAKAAAQRIRERYEDMGPWSDFEWGMLNGKLSALRWILGDDWDMLDT
jgi:hypothetical protein